MDAYFARQPILDSRMKVRGYELLFRPSPEAEASGDTTILDGDGATASVLDAISLRGIASVTGGKPAFVNFTEKLLLHGVANPYPREYLTVEVLESINATDEVIGALAGLKRNGYTIVLDDYVYKPGDDRLLDLADIIKLDALEDRKSLQNIHDVAKRVKGRKCTLLAEKVETKQMFEETKALGCSLFQGYFFAKPVTVLERTVSSLRINSLRLIRAVSSKHVDFTAVANIIKQDIGLSYKILRLVNSAYFGLQHEVKNIRQAVVILGTRELKKWTSFITMADMCTDKPTELIQMSLIRAHFCELVCLGLGNRRDADAFFLTGMFSLLDSMIDVEMEAALDSISTPKITRTALLQGGNKARWALDLITALERGAWDEIPVLCGKLGLDTNAVPNMYFDSLDWGSGFFDSMTG